MSDLVKLLGHFVFVQIFIILFATPFYFLYRRQHVKNGQVKVGLNQHFENFFLSKQANYLVFFWAMGEALIWFVIPEFLLLLLVFMRIRRKKELLMYDVAGTVAGTLLALLIHVPRSFIQGLPYIQDKMIDQTILWFDQLGVWGLIYQPFSGVPYKVFTLTASDYDFFWPLFILVAVIVRMSRYVITFGLFVMIYPGLHTFVKRNYVRLAVIATFIFAMLLVKVSNNFGPHYEIINPNNKQAIYRQGTSA